MASKEKVGELLNYMLSIEGEDEPRLDDNIIAACERTAFCVCVCVFPSFAVC